MRNKTKFLVCKSHCKFYKEEKKEEYACKGFFIMEELLGRKDLLEAVKALKTPLEITFKYDKVLKEAICKRCDFFVDGCDFRDQKCNYDAPPCGGFLLLSYLIERKIISAEEI